MTYFCRDVSECLGRAVRPIYAELEEKLGSYLDEESLQTVRDGFVEAAMRGYQEGHNAIIEIFALEAKMAGIDFDPSGVMLHVKRPHKPAH